MRGSRVAGDQRKPAGQDKGDGAPSANVEPPPAETAAAGTPATSSWTNLWQVPTIIVSAALIGVGLYRGMAPDPANDFAGALEQVEHFLHEGQLEPAEAGLRTVIEPNIAMATREQQAHFQSLAADYLFLSQYAEGGLPAPAAKVIAERYAGAVEMDRPLSPMQIERWAEAQLAIGDLAGARVRLADLDRLIGTDAAISADQGHVAPEEGHEHESRSDAASHEAEGGHGHEPETAAAAVTSEHETKQPEKAALAEGPSASRNRLFRRLVEYSLTSSGIPADELMRMLADYRGTDRLAPGDDIWAAARQMEIRLASGQTQQAVDMLLVDMRRLESRETPETRSSFGELYTLLGRAYFDLGDTDRAETQLEHAMKLFAGPEPARGDALVMLGQIAMARANPEAAYEKFHVVVRDFINTRSFLPGLLGRAEVESMLGDHDASVADYEQIRDMLAKDGKRRDVTAASVAASLCDRHDASVALGRLDIALRYSTLAEGLTTADRTPAEVLIRLASAHRQAADDLIAAAAGDHDVLAGDFAEIDPGVRYEANRHYERAGNYYVRHANAESEVPITEQQWADSMWLAADSYDLGGRQDLAIQEFRRYLDSRPNEDPRRAQGMYRVAQAQQATLEYDKAIATYELILAEQPRSTYAAKSHVPLARCYVSANRRAEAQSELQRVLSGDGLLKPDAHDYRDALIELGRIDHDGKEFVAAIELLTQARDRYPEDPRQMEVLYLLADSYRGDAMAMAESQAANPSLAQAEADRIASARSAHLQAAQELFGKLCDSYGGAKLNTFQKGLLRRADYYRADCAFYLGQYEQAIQYYDRAARAYSSHQSSLYALIQIVNSYSALGDRDRAAAAHHRALLRLKQLPDTAFADPDGLMDRAAWERWLDNTPVAPAPDAAASAAGT